MGKICYRPVYNRNNHLNTQGKALLQIEAYLERKKIYFSTHIYITPKQWSSKKAKVIRHPKADSLNYFLQEYIMELEQKELELWRKGFEVSLDLLKHEINPKTSNTFLSFVNEEISSSPVKESTRNNLKTTWHLLSQFKPHLGFEDLTPRLIHNFEKYMYEKNLEVNTIAKHLKHLKSFINSAIDKGFIDANKNPLSHYKIKTCQSKHTFLLPEEIRKLENLQLAGHDLTLEHSLDAFLFCCYTGLRYSDFTALDKKNIVEIEDKKWIVFHSIKTGVEVKLPIFLLFEGKAWNLLCKYQDKWTSFFKLKSNTCVNNDLKNIGKLAGIEKHFTFHSARHTNATLLIYNGANITTVQKLLGHRNISTTQIYTEIMGKTIVKDLIKCSNIS